MEGDEQPPPPSSIEHPKVHITILVLNMVGCLLLSILVVTISLSHRLPRRDPVVNNFLYTWIWRSASAVLDELTLFTKKGTGDDTTTTTTLVREAVHVLMTMVSTFNLSIHLWYTMRSAFHQCSTGRRKLRTLMLVLTPYIIGLIPLIALFNTAGEVITGLFFLAFVVINPAIDIALLIYYWRWYRMTRKANMSGLMSLSFLIRLLAFGIYQSVYSVLLFMGVTVSSKVIWTESFHLVQNTFPILAFCVIGLHSDLLRLWFPGLFRTDHSTSNKHQMESTNMDSHVLDITLQGTEEMTTDLQHLITRTDEDIRHNVFADTTSCKTNEDTDSESDDDLFRRTRT
ncbi:hypothetical protein BU17DRAFT_84983 [Hysterangium stoloniferum]|nr:hypothetical protein BU17DRAFT_84983 [Hysterangium stoloniferum]